MKIDKTKLISEKTKYSDLVNPSIDMKMKLKLNMGFLSFKSSKKTYPVKLVHKKMDIKNNENAMRKLLLKKPFFQDNPQLVEFAKKIRIKDGVM